MALNQFAEYADDWLIAPLAWWLDPDVYDWLIPERQSRGIYVPATWLFPGSPTIRAEASEICVSLGDQQVARFRYWNDDLRERHYSGAPPNVGTELLIGREWLEPQLAAGATLCWVVTLVVMQPKERGARFEESKVVGTWVFGGSRMVWPKPWKPE